MAVNKIIFGDNVLLDLTADTVNAESLAKGITAHDKTGAVITGTSTKDVDSTDATVAVAEILDGKTAYARGAKLTGTMVNNGGVSGTISTKTGSYTIPIGFHDGSGKITLSGVSQLTEGNVKNGVTILGITGTYSGDSVERPQAKTVNAPITEDLVVTPDTASGYTCLSQVTVKKVTYVSAQNSAGGTTVTIGG